MTIEFHNLQYADHLLPGNASGDTLHVVRAKGRAVQLEIPEGWPSLWMPLAGGLRIKSQDIEWDLAPREMLIWHEGGLLNSSPQQTWFLTLCGSPAAWERYLARTHDRRSRHGSIFPSQSHCPREVRRLIVHLARLGSRADAAASCLDHLAEACCNAIMDNQGEMREYLARCSGRTDKHRRHTLLRLLRVRHLIANSAEARFDLAHLGRIANYSPWHLTRTYRDVFGETPSEHAIRLRLARAMHLVRDSTLTVREITEELGFESQSTFCRSFKKAYGLTATQTRIYSV